jgi:heme-degrading monooxygenase HmoA
MIARIWKGRTPESKADSYLNYLKKTGVKEYRSTEGNRRVYVLRRTIDGIAEFTLISLWDSTEAIRKFAGPVVDKAVYYPEDKNLLLELEPKVSHFQVMVAE